MITQKTKQMIMKYKFRAECGSDVLELMNLLPHADIVRHNVEPDFYELPDVEVEIEFKNMQLDELRDTIRDVADGHVMLQTVQPIDKYTGDRDFNLK